MDDSTAAPQASASHAIIVLAHPGEPQLAMLKALPEGTRLAVGNSPADFERLAPEADVIFNWSAGRDLLRSVFALAPHVRWVHSRSAGLDTLLFPELIESPVPLTNGSGVFSGSLGEFALGAILYFAKDFRRLIRNQMAGKWEQFDSHEISGQTVGIVGYGDIGRAVATRVRSMGMRVLAVKRHGAPVYSVDPLVDRIYFPEQRCEMIALCDYVVVAAPLTAETRGMIGEAEFGAMKPDAVIINVGRGPVIDEPAMLKALTEGRIKGAGLDVFTHEPLPDGHPFYKMENVLLSPHSADHTMDWLEQAMRFFMENFERYAKGEPLRNIVDKKLGY
jgi:phosphoglycerate dehydrogenase-like enzyme